MTQRAGGRLLRLSASAVGLRQVGLSTDSKQLVAMLEKSVMALKCGWLVMQSNHEDGTIIHSDQIEFTDCHGLCNPNIAK